MKQKLALSCALIHKPKVLFLDEPTTGVDTVSRKELWGMLKNLKHEGINIIVSTPYMDEASLCDRIGLIRGGSFLKIDTPEKIIGGFGKTLWAVRSSSMSKLLKDLRLNKFIKTSFAFGDSHHVTADTDKITLDGLKLYLYDQGHMDVEISPIKAGIEDCFMDL
jgi:ABC-type multidrug transport system ATPase subunit